MHDEQNTSLFDAREAREATFLMTMKGRGAKTSISMKRFRMAASVSLAMASITGISAAGCSGGDDERLEEIATQSDAVTYWPAAQASHGTYGGFEWSAANGNQSVAMTPSASTSCFLSRIGGTWNSAAVNVSILDFSGTWKLFGSSLAGHNHYANAFCVDVASNTPTTWTSGSLDLGPSAGRTCFFTKLKGNLSLGTFVRLRIANGRWVFDGNNNGTIQASAACINRGSSHHVDLPASGGLAHLAVNFASSGPYMCALTRIAGAFRGGQVFTGAHYLGSSPNRWGWRVDTLKNPSFFDVGPSASAACTSI